MQAILRKGADKRIKTGNKSNKLTVRKHRKSEEELSNVSAPGGDPTDNSTARRAASSANGEENAKFIDLENGWDDSDISPSNLYDLFERLKSDDQMVRTNTAMELRTSIISIAREIPTDQFQRFINTLNNKIFELIHGSSSNEKMGGILAVDSLIDFYLEIGELSNQTTRLANYLRVLIPSNDIDVMRLATQTLGKLALPRGTVTSEFVDFEVKTCLEWLTASTDNPPLNFKQEYRRHAAILILYSLIENSPYLLFPYINPILDNIWGSLKDTKLIIRRDAAETMRKCMETLQSRDPQNAREWYQRSFSTATQGLNSNNIESIHATLLTFKELLNLKDSYIKDKYSQIFQVVIKFRDHKNDIVRREVYAILPLLAMNDSDIFASKYLDPTMSFYLKVLKDMDSSTANNADKEAIFISIGDLSENVRSKMHSYIHQLEINLREGLQTKYKIRKHYEKALFYCIIKLTAALGPAIATNINKGFLDLILSCPLSSHLLEVMATIKKSIPALSTSIDKRLIEIVHAYLSGERYNDGTNSQIMKTVSLPLARKWRDRDYCWKTGDQNSDNNDDFLLVQTLKMVDIIDPKHLVSEHTKMSIIAYIEHTHETVRKLAALKSVELYKLTEANLPDDEHALDTSATVLGKLLVLAITDPNSNIRLSILQSFDYHFSSQLAQPDNLRLLFCSVNDEVYTIRLEAIRVIGALTEFNPIYVVPEMQKIFLSFLTELKYSATNRKKENMLTLIHAVIDSHPDTLVPFIKDCLDSLIQRLEDNSSAVATIAMKTIGALAEAVGPDITNYVHQLMPIIISTLHNQLNSIKRATAIKTLIQISSSTAYVIDPLIEYPELLGLLMNILKTESNMEIKRDIIQLIGTLGAIDPYKYRAVETNSKGVQKIDTTQHSTAIDLLIKGMSPSNEEFYPSVVMHSLVKILNDNSLSSYHTNTLQTIMRIFQDMGVQSIIFLKILVPAIKSVVKTCPPSHLEFYFQQLSVLVNTVNHHIEPFTEDIFEIIADHFSITKLQVVIISLIESMSHLVKNNLKRFLPKTVNLFLNVLENDRSNQKMASVSIMKALIAFGKNLEDYSHLIIPTIVRICEYSQNHLRKISIVTFGKLAKCINLTELSSMIINALVRVLTNGDKSLIKVTMNTLCLLLLQLGNDFVVYIPTIHSVLIKNRIQHSIYDQLVNKLLNGEVLNTNILLDKDSEEKNKNINLQNNPRTEKFVVDQQILKSAWDCSQQKSKEDWQEWFRRLSVHTIRESASPSLRACSNLVSVYNPLARDLFNVSFSSCWNELNIGSREHILNSLCSALSSPQNPTEIYLILINLIEFMEHDMNPLPIPATITGEYAQKCNAFAKALHYKETEFIENEKPCIIESLIDINNQLHQPDASIGILKYAQQHYNLQLKETWYEKLQRWDDALQAYTDREKNGEDTPEVLMGKMRSLYALGNWSEIADLANDKWNTVPLHIQEKLSPIAAGSSWALHNWDDIEKYCSILQDNSIDKEFFSTVMCLHHNNFEEAEQHADNVNSLLVGEMSALINESYSRIYNSVAKCQTVAELKEIIKYKRLPRMSPKRKAMRETWNKRLLGCQQNIDVWQVILKTRSLVVNPEDDEEIWIKFANLCRRNGRMNMTRDVLNSLLKFNEMSENPNILQASPEVVYSYLKYKWDTGEKNSALNQLAIFIGKVIRDLGLHPEHIISNKTFQSKTNISPKERPKYQKLLATCFAKQGDWTIALDPNWSNTDPGSVLSSYLLATHFDPQWYKAWHNWALANFEVISMMSSTNKDTNYQKSNAPITSFYQIRNNIFEKNGETPYYNQFPSKLINNHVVSAIKGFFHSIALSDSSLLQDALRLLTLWFTFGSTSETTQAMQEGFNMVKISTWLEVLPQLISHIHQPNPLISRTLLTLLSDLGKEHPQALVYPLTVAIKSESLSRQKAAISIIDNVRSHSPVLVDQAELLSRELIRVVALWNEMWYEGLEDASRHFFGENDNTKMLETLEPLYELLNKGPETIREISFKYAFGKDLTYAYEWVKKYKETGEVSNLNQAWDIYYSIFKKINKQLPQMETLELQHVSPKLLAAKNLELAMPGTYIPGTEIVTIESVNGTCEVISSKQRPRKIALKGSDGKEYLYVLKGHEDIRQDSLVMQLFGLVNTLLQNDIECFQRHLDIQQYAAIPLSPKTGLLGWVTESDTIHVLIKDYRDAKKMPLNIEHLVMLQMAPDYDSLTLLQKVEVFKYVLDNTQGFDLYNILWLKSKSSETWLERRTTYTRSLAVMSMTGYILGLGDRHPSNLMLNRNTGKVVHIDFGDCFEAAILREKFPEKVPFRLTRMLIKAMEVSGVEGSFRITCENVMRVLRDNKDSLMAILEAFAFDPLIRWGFDLPTEQIKKENDKHFKATESIYGIDEASSMSNITTTSVKDKKREYINTRAVLVLKRISSKLTGNDIPKHEDLDVAEQVDHLIEQAKSVENLCQHYIGWCPFW